MSTSEPATPPTALSAKEVGVTRVLSSLRRILRRVELCSAELEVDHGVTQPQLVCLRAIVAAKRLTQVELARVVHLSASTLVGVIDRLEQKGLVTRTRDSDDRRRIFLSATTLGVEKVRTAPEPLHQRVQRSLAGLDDAELEGIGSKLEFLVSLLDAEGIDPQPMLASGPIPKSGDLEATA